MTRALLTLFLGLATLGAGLWTCAVQCWNHARARDLALAQRRWEILQAANAQAEAIVEAHVWGMGDSALRPPGESRLEAAP